MRRYIGWGGSRRLADEIAGNTFFLSKTTGVDALIETGSLGGLHKLGLLRSKLKLCTVYKLVMGIICFLQVNYLINKL